MEIVEAKKLTHKESGEVIYYKIPKHKSWWDICHHVSKDTDNVYDVYDWLKTFNVSDCYLLEANDGNLFKLTQIYTEN